MSSSSCPTLPFPGHFGELSALCALVPLMSLPVPALYLHPTSVPGASGPHPCPLHSLPPASLQASSGLMQPWIPAAASGLSIWCQTCAPCPPILFVPASPLQGWPGHPPGVQPEFLWLGVSALQVTVSQFLGPCLPDTPESGFSPPRRHLRVSLSPYDGLFLLPCPP